MRLIEWAQFILGVGMLLAGVGIFMVQLFGVFKFEYVLNRMHAAAMGDTLGIGISLTGLMVLSGVNVTSLKMLLVIVFLWLASPVSSHLIARLEVTTNGHLKELCKLPLGQGENMPAYEGCGKKDSVKSKSSKKKGSVSDENCKMVSDKETGIRKISVAGNKGKQNKCTSAEGEKTC